MPTEKSNIRERFLIEIRRSARLIKRNELRFKRFRRKSIRSSTIAVRSWGRKGYRFIHMLADKTIGERRFMVVVRRGRRYSLSRSAFISSTRIYIGLVVVFRRCPFPFSHTSNTRVRSISVHLAVVHVKVTFYTPVTFRARRITP